MNYLIPTLFILPFVAAIIVFFAGKISDFWRDFLACLFVAAETAICVYCFFVTPELSFEINDVFLLKLSFKLDGFRLLYTFVAVFMWFVTTFFSHEYFKNYTEKNRYYAFMLLTLGATVGLFMSDDLLTAFIFLEIMSFTSYVLVIHERTEKAISAAKTYITIAITGGLVMLMGLFLLYNAFGSLSFDALYANAGISYDKRQVYIASLLLLFGFGAKAGMFPLHIWLPKAHAAAPAPASALLSGILTKAGIFGIAAVTVNVMRANTSWGKSILLLAVITMLLGGFLGILSTDIKRTLACSTMSQIGFILIGISMMTLLGDQNQLAIRGTILYMLNHSFVKLVLFIISGVVFMNIHKLGFNEIKGFGRKKPLLIIPFALAALSLCGFPFTLGYEAKTLIHEAILALSTSLSGFDFVLIKAVEWAFIFSGGLTAAYMLKLFFCLFIEKSEERQGFENSKKYMSKTTSVLILCCSLIFPVLGIIPHLTSDKIVSFASAFFGNSGGDKINYFAISSLYNAFISILIGVLAYIFIVRRSMIKQQQYIDFSNDRCDIEKTIYVPFFGFLIKIAGYICHFISDLPDMIILFLRKTLFSESKEKEVSPTSGSIETTATKLAKFTYERILKKDHLKLKLDIRIAIVIETLRLTTRRILRNFSFAMMMACIGISITLIYMLFLA